MHILFQLSRYLHIFELYTPIFCSQSDDDDWPTLVLCAHAVSWPTLLATTRRPIVLARFAHVIFSSSRCWNGKLVIILVQSFQPKSVSHCPSHLYISFFFFFLLCSLSSARVLENLENFIYLSAV